MTATSSAETDGPPVPSTPQEWFSRAQEHYSEVLHVFERYGVRPDPSLRVIEADSLTPYYEHSSRTIGVGMPDATVAAGRLRWLFAARIFGTDSVDGAAAAMARELPMLMAHEVVHHLRHHYGAPVASDFIEEQVADEVAVALIREHPVHARTLPGLRAQTRTAVHWLRALSPEASRYLSGFRSQHSEVMVAAGMVEREDVEGMRLLAASLGQPLEELLDKGNLVEDDTWEAANSLMHQTAAYFDRRYAAKPFEYILFHKQWLEAHLDRPVFPSLGEAVEEHILTRDWERASRKETLRFLVAALRHPDEAVAASSAAALAGEEAPEVIPALLEALEVGGAALQAAALRTLAPCTPVDARVPQAAHHLMTSPHTVVRAAAARVLLSDREHGKDSRRALEELLACPATRLLTLDELVGWCHPALLPPIAEGLPTWSDRERVTALRNLGSLPRDESVAELAATALGDRSASVRRAAAQCLSGHHSESVVARLVHALDDPVRAVREESGAALRAHAPADKGILRAIPMSRYGRAEAALILHELGEAGAADALRDLVDEIIAAAEDLARRRQCFRDPGSVSQLLRDVLDEERHGLGCLALRLAGSLGDRDRMAIALHGLTDHRAVVRRTSRDLARSALPADLAPRLATFLVPQEDPHSPEVTVTPVTLTDLLSCPQPLVTTLVSEALALASTSGIRAEEQPMLTAIEKIVFLRSIPLFRGLSIGDLHPVAEACIFRQYSSNETVFSLGDPASDLYIITAGEVVIEQDVAECQFRRIATLGPTQQFGEASFFTGEPRSARAVTTQSTALLSLSREPFLELGQREPHILVEMIRVLSQRLRACNVDVG